MYVLEYSQSKTKVVLLTTHSQEIIMDDIFSDGGGVEVEKAIVSLVQDAPGFIDQDKCAWRTWLKWMKPEYFQDSNCKYIIATILNSYQEHGIVPSRPLLRSMIMSKLTVDEGGLEIEKVLNRQ